MKLDQKAKLPASTGPGDRCRPVHCWKHSLDTILRLANLSSLSFAGRLRWFE